MLTTQRATPSDTMTGLTGTHDAATRLCAAWQWLETQRRHAPEGADVWDICWQAQKSATYLTELLHTLRAGQYRLSPFQLHGQGNDRKAIWGAQDALVLKWVALCIEDPLPLHPSCEHVKGHGGGQQSVAKLRGLLTGKPEAPDAAETPDTPAPKKTADYAWVCRTDIRGYYRNINKATLLNQVRQHVQDPVYRDLINQYIHYTVEDGGTFHTPESSISRGCPLSPLMGALHLYDMDEHFSNQQNIHYARYMDDVIILAKSRWQLRKHTKKLMQWFSEHGFEAYPDKTQIGRTAKGFDWMGVWLTDEGVTDVAPRAKANHREKVRRLYERLARVPVWLRHRRQKQVHARVSAYRKRWNIWAGVMMTATAFALPPNEVRATTLSGLPAHIPPGIPQGSVLSAGSIKESLSNAQTKLSVGFVGAAVDSNNNPISVNDQIMGGQAVWGIFPNCRSIGFRPTNWQMTVSSATSSTVVPTASAPAMYGEFSPSYDVEAKKYANVIINGNWIALNDTYGPNWRCSSMEVTYSIQAQSKLHTITKSNGVVYLTTGESLYKTLKGENVGAITPSQPPAVCDLRLTSGTASPDLGNIKPSDVAAAGTNYVVKVADPIAVTSSCTGVTSTSQIFGQIAWNNPYTAWTLGVAGGGGEDGDTSLALLLATTKPTVNKIFTTSMCQAGTGTKYCDTFTLTPGTPTTLYPALIRTGGGAPVSGIHTIRATIKVVSQ